MSHYSGDLGYKLITRWQWAPDRSSVHYHIYQHHPLMQPAGVLVCEFFCVISSTIHVVRNSRLSQRYTKSSVASSNLTNISTLSPQKTPKTFEQVCLVAQDVAVGDRLIRNPVPVCPHQFKMDSLLRAQQSSHLFRQINQTVLPSWCSLSFLLALARI